MAALLYVRTGMALPMTLKAINVKAANQNSNIRGPYVVFEVKYLWSGWVKKDGVNANLV